MVAEIRVPAGSFTAAFGEDAVWVTSTGNNLLTRVDPQTNLIVETIAVGKSPRFLAVSEGAVWVLRPGVTVTSPSYKHPQANSPTLPVLKPPANE